MAQSYSGIGNKTHVSLKGHIDGHGLPDDSSVLLLYLRLTFIRTRGANPLLCLLRARNFRWLRPIGNQPGYSWVAG